jgi:CDP-glucose 4,6-dehydratase
LKKYNEALVNQSDALSKFWKGKRVLITGHTGFKGGWLSLWLYSLGAKVSGFALHPKSSPNLYSSLKLDTLLEQSVIGDIRSHHSLQDIISSSDPEIIFHLAAQPLVRESYYNTVETYETNVMGTVHLLEVVRNSPHVKSVVVVTSDKCYENKEWARGYHEQDPMGGFDPYSSSKGCAELITAAYRNSFFQKSGQVAVSTVRSGNVIGGGDWSQDRLIPDAVRAFGVGKSLNVRNPKAVRPWQHVLEPLLGYMLLAQKQFDKSIGFTGAWNFGPKDCDTASVLDVVNILVKTWGETAHWTNDSAVSTLHEAGILRLDCSKAFEQLNWQPRWTLEVALSKTVDWYKEHQAGGNMHNLSLQHIWEYLNKAL